MKLKLYAWIAGICLLFSALPMMAQDRSISGRVMGANDNATLPGVSILVKGTNAGTTTDGEGAFKLTVPTNAVLVFSFVG